MTPARYDVAIVGAGPAGLAAAAHAHANGLSYCLLERADHLADTIWAYQKRKYVMAEPGQIPVRSPVPFAAGSRESVLDAWENHVRSLGIAVSYRQELVGLDRLADGGFRLRTSHHQLEAWRVVLAIGTQGNQRRLGAPGEDLPHVSYRLSDPDELDGQTVVVVGAGDSALEVALALCERNKVYLVVRRPEIVRGKESLAREVDKRRAAGLIEVLFSTTIKQIVPGGIQLTGPQADLELAVDRVFLKIGTQPPRQLLESFGVEFASSDPEAKPVLSAVYESAVPGLFLVGAVTGRDLIKLGMNQGFEVIEHVLGREVVPADEEILLSRLPFWFGTARERIIDLMNELPLFGAVAEPADGAAAGRVSLERRQGAASEQLREVFLAATPRTYQGGEVIMRQGDYTDSVLALVSGSAEVWRRDDAGAETQVAVLSAGTFVGEMGLISGRRRNATLKAVGETRAIEVPRKAMLRLLYSAPAVKKMMDTTFVVRALQNYLFPQIPVGELWPLVARTRVERVDRNQVVFREGDPGDAVYIVRSGQVKLSKTSGDRELVIAYLVAGSVFGEGALVAGRPRSVTVTTIFPSELLSLSRRDFDAFVGRFPGLRAVLDRRIEEQRLATLKEEATPGAGRVLSELIREEVVMGTDALIIDEYRCIRCSNCIRACEDVHDDGQARLSLTGVTFANILAPNSCWQCENPLCMLDCPPDALYRDRRGEIHIRDSCIGCGNCASNCPYGNIFMVHPEPQRSLFGWLTRLFRGQAEASGRTVAVKCDLCSTLPGGPACVRSCPTGAAIRVKPQDYQKTIERLIVGSVKGR